MKSKLKPELGKAIEESFAKLDIVPAILRDDKDTLDELKSLALEIHELQQGFDDESEKISKAGCNLVSRAISIGDLLTRACKLVKKGEWELWVKKSVSFSLVTAQKYRKLAKSNASNPNLLAGCDSLRHAYLIANVIPLPKKTKEAKESKDKKDGKEETALEKLDRHCDGITTLLKDADFVNGCFDEIISSVTPVVMRCVALKNEQENIAA